MKTTILELVEPKVVTKEGKEYIFTHKLESSTGVSAYLTEDSKVDLNVRLYCDSFVVNSKLTNVVINGKSWIEDSKLSNVTISNAYDNAYTIMAKESYLRVNITNSKLTDTQLSYSVDKYTAVNIHKSFIKNSYLTDTLKIKNVQLDNTIFLKLEVIESKVLKDIKVNNLHNLDKDTKVKSTVIRNEKDYYYITYVKRLNGPYKAYFTDYNLKTYGYGKACLYNLPIPEFKDTLVKAKLDINLVAQIYEDIENYKFK